MLFTYFYLENNLRESILSPPDEANHEICGSISFLIAPEKSMFVRVALEKFLRFRESESPTLIPLWSPSMETQIMTVKGTAQGDRPGEWLEDGESWSNIRWPHNAGSDPHYTDRKLTFNPDTRVTKIGTTWWDWEARKSIAVGIDIDVAEGHAGGTTTVTPAQLEELSQKLALLPYITMVRSTSGRGIHVYVFFDPADLPPAETHHDHADNARKVLVKIEADLGTKLSDHVDCVGSVFWLWSSTLRPDSFALVKKGDTLPGAAIAGIEVPKRARSFTGKVEWDTAKVSEDHRAILQDIASQGFYFLWKEEVGLCHTHTKAIERVFEDRARTGKPLHGTFETSSRGSDPMTPNCFITPIGQSAFRVTRFGNGLQEQSWVYDNGSNYTVINEPTCPLSIIREVSKGSKKGRYQLDKEGLESLVMMLGESFPSYPDESEAVINPDSSITIITAKHSEGWSAFGKEFGIKLQATHNKELALEKLLRKSDTVCRFVVTPDARPLGWFYKSNRGWLPFKSYGEIATQVEHHFGELSRTIRTIATENPWMLSFKPFAGEYPGERQWNWEAPQFSVDPTDSGGDHPTIDLVLDHIGQSLDKPVQDNAWCRANGITCGRHYIQAWISCVIQYPDQPLPYLFLVGPQACGKSTLHEFLSLLFKPGVADGSCAMTSSAGYNADLARSVVVYLEEKDLSKEKTQVYARIKEWTTSRTLTVHEKYHTPYNQPNMLHFMQMANARDNMPLEDGDTRIVVLSVPMPDKPRAKLEFEKDLRKDVPSFLRTLLDMEIGAPCDRMRIPAITTECKEDMLIAAMSPPMRVCYDQLEPSQGSLTKLSDVYDLYKPWCEENGLAATTLRAFTRDVALRSDRYIVGTQGSEVYVANHKLRSVTEKKKPVGKYQRTKNGILEWTTA